MNDTERWLPVVGYEGLYEVSDHGRVRTVERFITYPSKSRITTSGRLLPSQIRKQYCRPNDHPTVGLVRPGEKRRTFDVHRLVLEAFVGPRPEGMEACHWNDIKTDNRASNLRWDTRSENTKDRIRNGIHPPSNKTHCEVKANPRESQMQRTRDRCRNRPPPLWLLVREQQEIRPNDTRYRAACADGRRHHIQ